MKTANNTEPRVLKLGTRDSLLAKAQSRLVADSLVEAHPGLQIELVEFSTRGDMDQTTPLSLVDDAQFFSAELDAALAAGAVDFCVHSWKDIDSERPAALVRAAVPVRAFPHDVILFRADITEHIQAGKSLRIGTCSVRRQINTKDFLQWALPACRHTPTFEFVSLRGPVHERVARITSDAADQLDGVVIALAGLERLWGDPSGQDAIRHCLTNARWMVLPLSEAPSAAAQGALAVETRADNRACRDLLQAIHDPVTEELVLTEQQLLATHSTVAARCGASAVSHPELGYVARLRGRTADGHEVRLTRSGVAPAAADTDARRWSGKLWQQSRCQHSIAGAAEGATQGADAVFVAHADALADATPDSTPRYWTSGPHSWRRLASQGIWIEGCADDLGFESVRDLLQAPVLQLPPLEHWTALTHRDATGSWSDSGVGKVIPTYAIDVQLDERLTRRELAECTHFYWSSARQYSMLKPWLPADAHHACGGGKTLRGLRAAGLTEVQPFVSRREWQQWAA